MIDDTSCLRCGEPLPTDEAECPYCSGRRSRPLLHREPVLATLILVIAVGLWSVAHGVTQAYSHRQDHLARTWYAAGDAALRSGRVTEAIADLRTSLAYSHDSPNVRLRLAEALAADGQERQAQAYLLALWEEQPGDGTVNLELARLAARAGELTTAQRYYSGAIYGVWNDNPIVRRRDVRLELVEFLLARQALPQALSELILLSADLPPDSRLKLRVGELLLLAGDPNRALAQFSDVVTREPRNAAALAGAGKAAFELQDYGKARSYLDRAVARDSGDHRAAKLLATASLILRLDPFAARIGREERNRRVVGALDLTQSRVKQCAEQHSLPLDAQPSGTPLIADYQELSSLKPRAGMRALRSNPDLVDTVMDLVFRSQADAVSTCGQPDGPDLALLLIGRLRGGRP